MGGRRGHSTTIGKFAKIHHNRRVSEIRRLGVTLRAEQRAAGSSDGREDSAGRPALRAD
ncbi:hypothetical protein GCM10010112_82940 [Actinoplanes lobatus]|uniref:Uncharacterized protein n=1 Tax=Actinoplanes lobatus TaxID=113568 RepID=A0A7W7HL27_9ACTN|nr:hypothetical protein [Actinoplanes lobatus]GGN94025.1 hypothetical protein GCM10010112_82940 [Actinoplanes lobatus]GIE44818.1 hypothetical protein Alo02nite_77160 [Actinoplanes lobatus]